ncbi:hypothetical protein C1645_825215 [Glomus cerebriforme]|uniref:Uncharacterized protein n=1 Tax=Glomus cerebriforme TaxID=658196 RepID=A0A397SSP7_9GLOM|nr:hypothetical protein C1645_825215 [Glomus cerebriforme]
MALLLSLSFQSDTGKWKPVLRALQSRLGRENEIEKRSLSFQSDTGKWKPVLRALQSRLGRENDSLCFQFDTGIRNKIFSNGSFSFLVGSPSVQALGIRKQFLDFVSGLFLDLTSGNSGLETFSFGNSGLETFAPGLGKLKHSVCSLKFGFLIIGNVSGLDIRIE